MSYDVSTGVLTQDGKPIALTPEEISAIVQAELHAEVLAERLALAEALEKVKELDSQERELKRELLSVRAQVSRHESKLLALYELLRLPKDDIPY